VQEVVLEIIVVEEVQGDSDFQIKLFQYLEHQRLLEHLQLD
jgi:hypothetical protein